MVAYSNSAFTSETVVTRKAVKAFPKNQEIVEWKKALKTETKRLVDNGYKNLDIIIKLVGENTRELEQSARTAYFNQCVEISKFGNELALEATRKLQDPEMEKFNQDISKQVNAMMENSCRKQNEENFIKRRNRLIENYFQNTNESKKNI